MNTTDERLRAAARTAQHMFPNGGDLPALRLPEPSRGRGHRHSPAGRASYQRTRRVRAWAAPLAAATAVTAVILGLVVPHQMETSAGKPKPTQPSGPTAPARSDKQVRALDALVLLAVAPVTGLQYDEGGKLIWMLRAQEYRSASRCAAAEGFHLSYQVPPYNLADYADNTQMPDLPRIASTHEFVSQDGLGVAANYPRSRQSAVNDCLKAAQAADQPLLTAYSAVNNAWWKIISRVEASPQVNAALPALQTCATRYGFPTNPYGPAAGPITSVAGFMDWVSNYFDGADSRGASPGTMNSLARHWTSVFVTCMTPVVDIYQGMLVKAQPGFLRQHESQIRRLDRLALAYLIRARG